MKNLWKQLDDHNRGRYVESKKHVGFSYGTVVFPPSTDPLKLNRIKVTLPPWDPNDISKVTPWVNMASLGCGNHSGVHCPPKRGDKVIVFAYRGDPHQLVYLTYPTVQTLPPTEQQEGMPEYRWIIRTKNGHKLELWEDPNFSHNLLETEQGHQILEDDVSGQRKIFIKEYEGRFIKLDSEEDWIEIKTNNGNRVRLRDIQGDILIEHGESESFIWLKKDKSVHINAETTLRLTADQIIIDPKSDLTWHIPATTHQCVDDGIDYITCDAIRESKCFDCETGKETGGNPGGGASSSQYEFIQNSPSDIWVINHNKNKYPQITVMDNEGFVIDSNIQHINKNQAKIYFSSPTIGKAVCD